MTDTPRGTSDSPRPLPTPDEEEHLDRSLLIGLGGKWLTDWALRLSILLVTGWLLYRIGATLWVGILPILLAIIVSTVLWPPVRWMTRHHVPAALAALLSILGMFAIIGGIIALVAPTIIDQSTTLADRATDGIRQAQDWIKGPPFNVQDDQLDKLVAEGTARLQSQSEAIANGVFTGVSAVGEMIVTLLLVLVLAFFFIKDGPSFLPWVRRLAGRRAGLHLTEVLARSWNTLSGFIRAQAIVSFTDALFIGIGLVILGVPMAWALAVITFLGGFIPIIGGFTAGTLAVFVALVANGPTTALIVLVMIIAIMQLEGHVLQPVLQSKAMNLHPVVVLIVVAAGTALYGIIGAFLAVPFAAVAAVILRYLGEQIDLRTGDVLAADLQTATDEGRLTAFLGELSSTRFAQLLRPKPEGSEGSEGSRGSGDGRAAAGTPVDVDDDSPDNPEGSHRFGAEEQPAEQCSTEAHPDHGLLAWASRFRARRRDR